MVYIMQEQEREKKKRFKPYTGRLRSPGLKVTESLEQTEMSLLTQEIVASMPPPEERHNALLTMPASCHSILKVTYWFQKSNEQCLYLLKGLILFLENDSQGALRFASVFL